VEQLGEFDTVDPVSGVNAEVWTVLVIDSARRHSIRVREPIKHGRLPLLLLVAHAGTCSTFGR
jgi:hypothetical protein